MSKKNTNTVEQMKYITKSINNRVICYPTTFLPFDFANGNIEEVSLLDRETNDPLGTKLIIENVGISSGSVNMFVGEASSGKTTFSIQTACAIAQRFKNSRVEYRDLEGGLLGSSRVKNITGWTDIMLYNKFNVQKYSINPKTGEKEPITSESLFNEMQSFCKNKMEVVNEELKKVKNDNDRQYTYNTGIPDAYGNFIIHPIPDIYILDSLHLLGSRDLFFDDKDPEAGKTANMRQAQLNNTFFKQINPLLMISNTIFIVINHTAEEIQINAFSSKKSKVNTLAGKTLPGGKMSTYLSTIVTEFSPSGGSKNFDSNTNEFGIDGWFVVDVIAGKGRLNSAGRKIKLLLDQTYGFNRPLSFFLLLEEKKLIHKDGNGYRVGDCDIKFSKKNLLQKYDDHQELRYAFKEAVLEASKSFMSEPRSDENNKIDQTAKYLMQAFN